MDNYKAIQEKWQKKWKENKVFEPKVDKKKDKFFITVPYPYISGSLHIGHARVVTEADVYSRYLRMLGKNVLFPLSFHISGTPVLGISLAIKNGDKNKIALYRKYIETYINDKKEVDKILKSFEEPWNIVKFFSPKMIAEFSTLGLGIDWSRTFTSGDIEHQRLVEWQFQKYKEQNFLVQGKHPVLYSLSLENAVGEDDISDGDISPVEKNEFTLLKFKFEDGYMIAATLRPETMYGQTNMWVNPSVSYVKAEVNGELWYISKECAEKLDHQDHKVKIVSEVKGKEFLGKTCFAPFVEKELIILPLDFCNPDIGSGIVTSVPGHAPIDYIRLVELQNSKKECEKYGLDHSKIKAIEIVPILKTKEYGTDAAIKLLEKGKVTSSNDEKLKDILKQVYKLEHHTGVLLDNCGPFSGMIVPEAKEAMRKKLIEDKKGEIFYEVSRAALSRDGGKIIVAILDNQWFLDFNAKGWKDRAHKCLTDMNIVPNKYRKQFEDTFDWLDKRPCARRRGLGTQLPFDQKWVIESLSDSTIYMSLYTIHNLLKEYKVTGDQLAPSFFDYVYRGEGDVSKLSKELNLDKKKLETLRESFDYWYPNDHRHTFTAHLSNHLSFMIFAHTACFKKDKWPKKISFHGMVLSEGAKMSKSKGNTVTLVELNDTYGADSFRAFLCNSTSVESTMNWQSDEVLKTKNHLSNIQKMLTEIADNRGKGEVEEKWFVSKVEKLVKRATESLDNMDLRDYSNVILYDLQKEYNKVQRSTKNLKTVNNYVFPIWVKMLTPIVPHLSEEAWEKAGETEFASLSLWPAYDEKKFDAKAEFVEDCVANLFSDVEEIKKLAKIDDIKAVKIIVSPEWKFKFVSKFKELFEKEKNVGNLIKGLANKENGKAISKLVPVFVKHPAKVPKIILSPKEEQKIFESKKEYIEKRLGCTLTIEVAEKSSEKKANNALPSKPAILVQ
jgi:leucyl-tRNA synthetase